MQWMSSKRKISEGEKHMFVYMYVFIYEEMPDMIFKSLRELRRHQTPWQINYYRTVMWQTFEKIAHSMHHQKDQNDLNIECTVE